MEEERGGAATDAELELKRGASKTSEDKLDHIGFYCHAWLTPYSTFGSAFFRVAMERVSHTWQQKPM